MAIRPAASSTAAASPFRRCRCCSRCSRSLPRLRPSRCRSACPGPARISASTRSPRSSWSWSASAAPAPASTRSATAGTNTSRNACLPFYPAFLAGLNLVVLADDAFSFLFAWELMSLASWALVMSHHRESGNAHAGYRLYHHGELFRACPAAVLRPAGRADRQLRIRTRCARRIPRLASRHSHCSSH